MFLVNSPSAGIPALGLFTKGITTFRSPTGLVSSTAPLREIRELRVEAVHSPAVAKIPATHRATPSRGGSHSTIADTTLALSDRSASRT